MDAENRRRARGVPLMGAAVVALIIIVFGAIAWWGIASRARATTALERDTAEMSLPSVSVVSPKPGAPQEEIVLPATMQAFAEAPIYARTSGYLSKRFVELGTRVRANQVLAEIDAPELEQQLQQARADLTTADANARLAQVTADRYRDLVKTDSVPQQDADNAAGTLEARKAAVESARHNVQRLEQLQAFTRITAPYRRRHHRQEHGRRGAHRSRRERRKRARAVPHRVHRPAARLCQRAAALLTGGSARSLCRHHACRVPRAALHGPARADRTVDRPGVAHPAHRDRGRQPGGELLPGAYAQVHLKLETPASTLVLPVNALMFRGDGVKVAVVGDGSRIRMVTVMLGRDFGTEAEIVTGLAGTEAVVVSPPDSLADGQEVRVVATQTKGAQGAAR